ncbi:MAG: tripartite tricarboxylate transporter TctB family protein [Pseudomonadota bacterium]
MLTQRVANIVFAIAVLFGCAYFAWVAEGFVATGLLASSGLPSKFFPQLLLAFTAVCAVIVLVVYTRHGRASADEAADATVFESGGHARRGLLALAATVVCYVLWREVGYLPMAAVAGVLMGIAMDVRNPVIYVTNAVLAGGIYLVFTQLLGTQF